MRAEWMADVKVGDLRRSLLSKRVFTVTGIDWGLQTVTLRDPSADDYKQLVRLERLWEYYEVVK
jgi:hypothetical protein